MSWFQCDCKLCNWLKLLEIIIKICGGLTLWMQWDALKFENDVSVWLSAHWTGYAVGLHQSTSTWRLRGPRQSPTTPVHYILAPSLWQSKIFCNNSHLVSSWELPRITMNHQKRIISINHQKDSFTKNQKMMTPNIVNSVDINVYKTIIYIPFIDFQS